MTGNTQRFASDNYSDIYPGARAAMAKANRGHERACGDDQRTTCASDYFHQLFETDCKVFSAFSSTTASSLTLAVLCRSYHNVICSETARVETNECDAPGFFSDGSKLLLAQTEVGKLTPASIRDIALKRQDIHYPKPRMVTLTQATEAGAIYRPDELEMIGVTRKGLGLHLHMNGARFSSACAFLGCSPAGLSWKAGVDVLCFGGIKNGMAVGGAILLFSHDLTEGFDYRYKQAGQLASKMRFLAAPWVGVLQDDAWLRYTDHTNRCARLLAELVAGVPGVSLMFPVEANGAFLQLSEPAIETLHTRDWRLYTFIGEGDARFMCSWDTDIERIRGLTRDIRPVMGA